MTLPPQDVWRSCNICKAAMGFEAEYFCCSVSTCNRKRTGLFFCSLACFEAHLPEARHRDAWAERQRSPSRAEALAELAAESEATAAPAPRRVVSAGTAQPEPERPEPEAEVLVVVSKLKKYVKDWSGMNTSDGVVAILSEHLRELCREAIRQAGVDGRRTVLDRDFTKVLEQLTGATRDGHFRGRR
ncbi:MAG TPA: hypothetical protein VJU61_03345 [Polyangiaceae bacterium]|nr:hypothetical protein [Polyangiaceae bacterium]